MKKNWAAAIAAVLILTAGCKQTADLLETDKEVDAEVTVRSSPIPTPKVEEPKTTIPLTTTLKMTNDWTIMGDFNMELTQRGKKDRIVLATSAKAKNGEMQWDDSQYWTLAVIAEDGAYNLFSQRMQGYVYMEANEGFIRGVSTEVITAYIFSGADREIRNYIFDSDEGVFVEEQMFSTAEFSTGGINNLYSTIPEYKAK
ncbi:MAG: hypothetical protein PUE13_05195 [Clostridiales bacterium]|nr:hypothetical protein [Clostridiales bacterium]